MASPAESVAFIGLGVMGYGMAVNLRTKLDRNTTMYICDVSEAAIERFKDEVGSRGPIEVVKNGAEAAEAADTLFSMLPDGPAVKSVYLDETTGVLAGVRKAAASSPINKLIVECGTIENATILEVAKASIDTEKALPGGSVLDFVDAPVSGGPNGATGGTLAFMVGTDRPDTAFDRVQSYLKYMGRPDSIFLCGGIGAGVSFKIINNYISAVASLASSEALNIGVKLGLDPKRLTDVINASGGQTWITSNINPPELRRRFPYRTVQEGPREYVPINAANAPSAMLTNAQWVASSQSRPMHEQY
ncbi:uncharacterized protein LTR77_002116 [Saxophila tyrrhenica]|uniref:3-hydroxyisobutyrate dehydrogenase n=1 Tax=Saxophila tyrrhenica TaxID=1690608 RepID=A0AAV9PIA0_9PEZI|nr:hypothetical protein LTR77_002116 [Saxophila tyrrhenica]